MCLDFRQSIVNVTFFITAKHGDMVSADSLAFVWYDRWTMAWFVDAALFQRLYLI